MCAGSVLGVQGCIVWGVEIVHQPAGYGYDLDAMEFRMLRRMPDLLRYGSVSV